MLEHLIHVKTWFPKYEAELAERTHYHVFSEKSSLITSSIRQIKQAKVEPTKQEQVRFSSSNTDENF
ncbi:unnamed protein product [Rotaria sp. Silwood2]|nr:unnamed protein product [Rotaria sp. Silwood2]